MTALIWAADDGVQLTPATIILALMTLAGTSAFGVFINTLLTRRKTTAETEKSLAEARKISQETSSGLIGDLRSEILRKDAEHDRDLAELRTEVVHLRERLGATEQKLAASDARADRAESHGEVLAERLEAVRADLARTKSELSRYQARTAQLESAMRTAGVEIPPWPNGGKP